jgi:hypothetical protein
VELDFLVASSDKVVDNMGRRGVAAGTAEPFIARETFDNATGVVDSAVRASVGGEFDFLLRLHPSLAVDAVYSHACHTLHIIIVIDICYLVIIYSTPTGTGEGVPAKVSIENTFIIAGINRGR